MNTYAKNTIIGITWFLRIAVMLALTPVVALALVAFALNGKFSVKFKRLYGVYDQACSWSETEKELRKIYEDRGQTF